MNIEKDEKRVQERKRKLAHLIMSLALFLTVLIFNYVKNDNVVDELLKAANYTYGPLLGLFMFGIISTRKVHDYIPIFICILIPTVLYFINKFSTKLFDGYIFGSELLGIIALLVFIFLWIFSTKNVSYKEIN